MYAGSYRLMLWINELERGSKARNSCTTTNIIAISTMFSIAFLQVSLYRSACFLSERPYKHKTDFPQCGLPCDFHRTPNAMLIICATVTSWTRSTFTVCHRQPSVGQTWTNHPPTHSHLEQTILLKTDSPGTRLYRQLINGL